jgi:hypothetical protein
MSGIIGALASIPGVGAGLTSVLLQPARSIGTIIPDCTIEERHTDRLQLTQHPVEFGAQITDHAYMLPFEVSLRYGWSNAFIPESFGSLPSALGNIDRFVETGQSNIDAVYGQLRDLQQNRVPFTLITGKRNYDNMMLTELEVTTDQHSEYNLIVSAYCRQIFIVQTSAATIVAPAADQAQPADTTNTTDRGPVQALPVPPIPPGTQQFFAPASAGLATLPAGAGGGLGGGVSVGT